MSLATYNHQMDNPEIVIDIASTSNTIPTPRLPYSQIYKGAPLPPFPYGQTNEGARPPPLPHWQIQGNTLCNAIYDNNWDRLIEFLEQYPEAINGPIGPSGATPVHLAIECKRDMRIIEHLINVTPPEILASLPQTYSSIWDKSMGTIQWAVKNVNYSAAKLLISKNPGLLNSLDKDKRAPICMAFLNGETEMANYLLKLASTVKDENFALKETACVDTLMWAIKWGDYGLACTLIQQYPKLALHESPWKVLIEECEDFPCRSQLNIFESNIYSWINMNDETVSENLTQDWKKANSRFSSDDTYPEIQSPKHEYSQASRNLQVIMLRVKGAWRGLLNLAPRVLKMLVSPIKSVRLVKLNHHQTLHFLKGLCEEIKKFTDEDRFRIVRRVYFLAVQNGMSEIVGVIVDQFPDAIKYKDDDGNNALQFTASHRDGKTFDILYDEVEYSSHFFSSSLDHNNNNILHLVAKKARRNRLDIGSSDVLQLQREFQWYKEMEKKLRFNSELKFQKNKDDQVPLELFDKEHEDMLKSESEWMSSMANSCMVAGSLIAAVVFAAAITLPGGNKDGGLPNFSKERAFEIFAISDAFALVSSLTAVVTFLSIFTTRYSVESFQYNLPNKLILGLLSLLFSVTFLMVAFCATIYLLFTDDYSWIIYPTVVVSIVPVFFFAYLQLPSLINVIKSTYYRNIFNDSNVTVLVRN